MNSDIELQRVQLINRPLKRFTKSIELKSDFNSLEFTDHLTLNNERTIKRKVAQIPPVTLQPSSEPALQKSKPSQEPSLKRSLNRHRPITPPGNHHHSHLPSKKPKYSKEEIQEFMRQKKLKASSNQAPTHEPALMKSSARRYDHDAIQEYMKRKAERIKRKEEVRLHEQRTLQELKQERLRQLDDYRRQQRSKVQFKGIIERTRCDGEQGNDENETCTSELLSRSSSPMVSQQYLDSDVRPNNLPYTMEFSLLSKELRESSENTHVVPKVSNIKESQDSEPYINTVHGTSVQTQNEIGTVKESNENQRSSAESKQPSVENDGKLSRLIQTARLLNERVSKISELPDETLVALFSRNGHILQQKQVEPVDKIPSTAAEKDEMDDAKSVASLQEVTVDTGVFAGEPVMEQNGHDTVSPPPEISNHLYSRDSLQGSDDEQPEDFEMEINRRIADQIAPPSVDASSRKASAPPLPLPAWKQPGDQFSIINIIGRRWSKFGINTQATDGVNVVTVDEPVATTNECTVTADQGPFAHETVKTKDFIPKVSSTTLDVSSVPVETRLMAEKPQFLPNPDVSTDSTSSTEENPMEQSIDTSEFSSDSSFVPPPPRLSPKSLSQAMSAQLNLLDAAQDAELRLLEYEHSAHAAFMNEEMLHVALNQRPVSRPASAMREAIQSEPHIRENEDIQSEAYTTDFDSLPVESVKSYQPSPAVSRPRSALSQAHDITEHIESDLLQGGASSRPHSARESDGADATDNGFDELSGLDKTVNEGDFVKMSTGLIDDFLSKEKSKRKEYEILLGVKEKALEQHAKAEIAYLREQRRRGYAEPRSSSDMERAIMVRLATEKAEIARLKKLNQEVKVRNQKTALRAKLKAMHELPAPKTSISPMEVASLAVEEISEAVEYSVSESFATSVPETEHEHNDSIEMIESIGESTGSSPKYESQESYVSSADSSINVLMEKLKSLKQKAEDDRLLRKQRKLQMTKQLAKSLMETRAQKLSKEEKIRREIEHINRVIDEAIKAENASSLTRMISELQTDEPSHDRMQFPEVLDSKDVDGDELKTMETDEKGSVNGEHGATDTINVETDGGNDESEIEEVADYSEQLLATPTEDLVKTESEDDSESIPDQSVTVEQLAVKPLSKSGSLSSIEYAYEEKQNFIEKNSDTASPIKSSNNSVVSSDT